MPGKWRQILILAGAGLALLATTACNWFERQDHAIYEPIPPSFTLRGNVYNQVTGAPMPGLKVILTQAESYDGLTMEPRFTFTDTTGYFQILEVPRGRYPIRFYRTGAPGQDEFDTSNDSLLFSTDVGIITYEDRYIEIEIDPSEMSPDSVSQSILAPRFHPEWRNR